MLNRSMSSMPTSSLMKQQSKCSRKMSDGVPSFGNVWRVQPEWRFCTCSERARKYGIHPMSPSVRENFNVGKRSQNVAQMSSPKVASTDAAPSAMVTLGGASLDVCAPRDEEPTCVHSTVSVSHAAAKTGSQKSVWIDGMFSA